MQGQCIPFYRIKGYNRKDVFVYENAFHMHIYKQFFDILKYPSIQRFIFFIFMSQSLSKTLKIKEDKDGPHYHINNHEGISECMINILRMIERQRWNWT